VLDRVFGSVVGWLIGLTMVAFGLVGFSAINQATPLSSVTYLSGPGVSTTGGSAPGPAPTKPSTPGTKAPGGTTKPPTKAQLVSLGKSIITAKCEACHVVNGTGGTIGPNLDKVMAGQTLPGMVPGGKPTNAAWLSRWIANPQAVWPQAIMPNLGLTPTQVQAVVTYITTQVK